MRDFRAAFILVSVTILNWLGSHLRFSDFSY